MAGRDPQNAQAWIKMCRQAFRVLHGLDPTDLYSAWPLEDAPRLLAWARRHRMLGLLHAHATSASPTWRNPAFGQVAYTARCTSLAEKLQAHWRNDGLPMVLVKGPALARQAWPDAGIRSFDDLDYRCPRSEYDTLCRIMTAEQCEPEHSDSVRQSHYWQFGWGIMFRHPEGILIEVNHRSFLPHYPYLAPLSVGDVRLCQSLAFDTETVITPTPSYHLLLCSMHLVWHGGERLSWVADIAGLLVRHPSAFQEAERLARQQSMFAVRALHTACTLAEKIFGPHVLPAPAPMQSLEGINYLETHLTTERAPQPAAVRALHRALLSPLEQANYSLRYAFGPGDGDFRSKTFSKKWRWLYWIWRPWRVLRNAVLCKA